MKTQMLSKNRKAQAALFIGIGVVLLVAFGLVYYFVAVKTPSETKPVLKEVPTEVKPVNQFIESCIKSSAVDGLVELGKHGGYISPEKNNIVVNELEPTENSDGVNAFSNDVAYWHYLKTKNTCTGYCEFSSKTPYLYRAQGTPSIEGQLDEYVNENLRACLNDFYDFKQQGFTITELGSINTKTSVLNSEIGFYVEYPLDVALAESKHSINEFYVRVPINIKNIYEVAYNITSIEADNNSRFFEKFTQELISIFGGTSQDKLPSTADLEFKATGTMWSEQNVRNMLQGILFVYTQAVQLEGARNYQEINMQDQTKNILYNGMVIPSSKVSASHSNVGVEFFYLNWPVYMNLDCKSGICKPEQVFNNLMMIPFGMQRYDFAYDVSYPVLVAITDPAALNGKGYVFNFAFEVNVRNNKPMQSEFNPVTMMDFGQTSMLCDPQQRASGEITLEVKDSSTNKYIKDAVVTYSVGDEGCVIGQTDSASVPLKAKFPSGSCGIVTFTHEDYLGKSVPLCLNPDEKKSISVSLQKYYYINVTAVKKSIVKQGSWQFQNIEQKLSDDEDVVLVLQRINEPGDEDFASAVKLSGSDIDEIRIVPGSYDISAQLNLNQPVRIPERTEKKCTLFGLSCTSYTLPDVVFDVFPEGTIAWNTDYSYWQANKYLLSESSASGKLLKFYVLSFDLAGVPEQDRRIDDVESLNNVPQWSRDYKTYLQPQIMQQP